MQYLIPQPRAVGILALIVTLAIVLHTDNLGRNTSVDTITVFSQEEAERPREADNVPPPSPAAPAEDPEPAFQPLDIPLPADLQQHTYKQCEKFDIPFEVALALMYAESRYQLDAVHYNTNGTFDSGPMQINSVNHGWLLERHGLDITQPEDNIEAALLILSMHLDGGDLEYALTAYNQGAAGATRLGGQSAYAKGILENCRQLATL